MSYYKRIRDLREDHDKTQSDIAKLLGMKQPQYCRYENGTRDIPLDALITLARYYNVSTDYILGLSDNSKPI
ncbi:MAG: helix-turn-helix domain-containing protein [Clostridiales bacterium]|nr:helix-turn-helix domain-containing protein [Clostridiales bacterium]